MPTPKPLEQPKPPVIQARLRGKPIPLVFKSPDKTKSATEEAQLFGLRFKGRRCVIRIHNRFDSQKTDLYKATRDFLEHSLFHELFPEHSINPLGVQKIEVNGQPRFGMVSEIVSNRSKDYKAFHREFYTVSRFVKTAPSIRHAEFVQKTARPLVSQIFAQSGIILGDHPANVTNVGGKPVFFEIAYVDKKKLRTFITQQISDPPRQKNLLALVKQLERFP